MNKFDIVIPTRRKHDVDKLVESFKKYLPGELIFHVIEDGHNWPTATNIGLRESKNDVVICDDDIELEKDTFKGLRNWYHKADMFGFKLLFPNREIQHAGGYLIGHYGTGEHENTHNKPRYCDHITTSLAIIKKHVFEEIGYMAEDYPGDQFEDIDFTMRMGQAGFKKMYIPNKAIHYESATKKQTIPDFNHRMTLNYNEFKRRYNL